VTLTARLLRLARHAHLPWFAAALAVVLTLPMLAAGYFLDDDLHTFVLRGGTFPGGPRGDWDLYRFADGGEGVRAAIDQGLFPWWTSPELKLAFFRPLSSLWRAADFRVWGAESWVPHLETSIAYALLALVAARLYGRWFAEPDDGKRSAAAGLAALMFTVDDAHALVTTWVANRYALLAALLGLSSVLVLAISPARRANVALSALLFALALAAGEPALGVVGYLLAHAYFTGGESNQQRLALIGEKLIGGERADPAARRARLLRLVPHGGVLAAWAVIYRLLGYGAAGNAFYVDPLHDPLRFALTALERLPQLALAQLLGPPSEVWAMAQPSARVAVALGTWLAAGLLFGFVWRLARHHRLAPVFAWGALIAALPMCATNPDDRLLLLPGFGAFGLMAIAMHRVWQEASSSFTVRATIAALAVVHLAIAPLLLPLRGMNMSSLMSRFVGRGAASIPAGPEAASIVILGTPDVLMTNYMFVERFYGRDVPPPPHIAPVLTVQNDGVATVERTGERTVIVRNERGQNGGPWTVVYRKDAFRAGERFRVRDLEVEILELGAAGLPTAIQFTFDQPLEDQRWLYWREGEFVPTPVVKVGEQMSFKATPLVEALR